jgi:hypothetical protein
MISTLLRLARIQYLLLITTIPLAAQELSLDQLIAKNVEACGGKTAIESVKSIKFDVHIVDPGFEADGVYYAERPGKMRIDVMVGRTHVYAEGFDGHRAWQWNGKGDPVDESVAATQALQHGIELPNKLVGLHELAARGNKLELIGREKIDNINYYVLNLTFADGIATRLYLDPHSWLITRRRSVRPLHPDIDPTPTTIEATMTDFRKVGGLMFPFSSKNTDLKTGKLLEKTTTRDITLNPAVEPRLFETVEPGT